MDANMGMASITIVAFITTGGVPVAEIAYHSYQSPLQLSSKISNTLLFLFSVNGWIHYNLSKVGTSFGLVNFQKEHGGA